MKHLLNNLSEEEKNAIREQHVGGMKINVDKFKSLVESKLGDVKPYKKTLLKESHMNKAESLAHSPELNQMIDDVLDNFSDEELSSVKKALTSAGFGPDTDVPEAISIADDIVSSESSSSEGEMFESDDKLGLKDKIIDTVLSGLSFLGVANAALFGMPITLLIDKLFPEETRDMVWGDKDQIASMVLGIILSMLSYHTLLKREGNRLKKGFEDWNNQNQ